MAKHTFPYTMFEVAPGSSFPAGRRAARPILEVSLSNGLLRLSCYAIVDSGADHCAFPRSFLKRLGLERLVAPQERVSGIGGSAFAQFHEVTLEIPGIMSNRVYAPFGGSLDDWGVGLLGQSGFFDQLRVSFDLRRGVFEIEP